MPAGTAKQRILAVLRDREAPICDDCLANPAEVSNRTYVNQVANRLAGQGKVTRGRERCAACDKVKKATWTGLRAQPAEDDWLAGLRYPRSRWPLEKHLRGLDDNIDGYIQACAEERIFSGPSVHFYRRVVQETRKAPSPETLRNERRFHELVYATLTSWGMHRMGPGGAKLAEFATFSTGLQTLLEMAEPWWGESLLEVDEAQAAEIGKRLGDAVEVQDLVASETPLVTNSKTLHFLLPDLVPPMDRSYTGRFFYGPNTGRMLPGPAANRFEHMFRAFHRLAQRNEDALRNAAGTYLCHGHAKSLDNAIVGYVRRHDDVFG